MLLLFSAGAVLYVADIFAVVIVDVFAVVVVVKLKRTGQLLFVKF
jgi:hypothetical protein